MATGGEEVEEYESDPEDAPLPSMRRREASDDEDGSDGGGKPARRDPRLGIGSDVELDGQGGAHVYEDDEEFGAEEYVEEFEAEEEVEEELEEEGVHLEELIGEEGGHHGSAGKAESPGEGGSPAELAGDGRRSGGEPVGYRGKSQVEEEKKENEPYAVPTAGAFYMHDDRFQENGRGRHRRMFGGRKLWDPKDDHAWVHDRFEEMNLKDTRYDEERRRSKGRFRGRGGSKSRGGDRGYARGSRSRAYYDDGGNQNRASKSVRGRGPRRYEPIPKSNSGSPATQNKQSVKPQEATPNVNAGRTSSQTSSMQPEQVIPRKHVFASSLSSASPPFYPSGSSNQEISMIQKGNAQTGSANKTLSSSVQMEDNFPPSQSSSLLRGKMVVDSVSQDRLYVDDSLRQVAGKTMASSPLQSSGFSLLSTNAGQSSNSRVHGRGLSISGLANSPSAASLNQAARIPAQTQPPTAQQRPVQTPNQPALRIPTQQLGQRPGSGNQASSPPQPQSANSSEVGETDSPPGSSKSRTALVGKGKTSNQGAARGGFLYSGAQVIGATGSMGLAHCDQNFPGTPALLPVMQFGGQHPGGLGVPAVGMALPGYVAQPQLGFGNSEMTWVPVLAGAAGALGASYCSPYIAIDGSYYARPSGQMSSSVSSRETGTAKPANSWKPPERPEIVNDEFGQRQNKPRRYSEMNFGQ
ncbi:protein MLN51 homolog isoform X2 [Elaeis guineensis]|uniref:Protein MLN51 homolog isoform X2 n=1 Tax=Elaeis guineensis var. tenera TaxID=51953 RepID=A0A6I9S5Y3_ELAGV|nr:protein MLN51 homolog isoform X2 [Elaeis guineensis]XP_010938178.1 protein MLN51 homolog isoform X2 [Elaeis guineensis]XP_029118753.1 protein MLN51 homolog isoform X2 [Elaeis guineensis]XP_029118756.1 protein MLN51 homolog isoform X2 [Elaeis guineensis]